MDNNESLLKIINKSFCFDKSTIIDSSLNKVNEILKILDLDEHSKIIQVGHGTNSCVFLVNNKILKVGFYKLNKLIIKHPRIITVYFKDNIEILHDSNIIGVGIEIQDYATTYTSNDIDKLYNVYKELRDDGILWSDVKPSNVGYYNNKIVVIDTDDCYLINNKDDIQYVNDIANKFELIYNEYIGGYKNE